MKLNIVYLPTDTLVEYGRNPRKNDAVVDKMVASIKEFGFSIPILATPEKVVIDGHLRLKAARKLNLAEVPVVVADGWTEAQVKAFRLLANRSVAWAEWDEELLRLELEELKGFDFDLDMTGFDKEELDLLFNGDINADGVNSGDVEQDSAQYSTKIEAPIYEPSGIKPELSELFDVSKTLKLIEIIKQSSLDEKEKEFLIYAAYRHSVFNFRKIADYYSHSNKAVQELMEQSALIIIDFNKAIENGYVKLAKNVIDQYLSEKSLDDEDDEDDE